LYKIRFYLSILLIISCIFNLALTQQKGGRWQFENNGYDTAEWDQINDTGYLQGNASFQSFGPLKDGVAYLMLDSSQICDYFRVDDSDDLDFENENIAISLWIYPQKSGDDVHYLLNKGDQYSEPKTTNYALRISYNGNIEFVIRDNKNKAQTAGSSFTVNVGEWNFIGLLYDYIKGKVYFWNQPYNIAVDSINFKHDFFPNNDPLAIGSWFSSSPTQPSVKDFEGRIDDVRIGTEMSCIFNNVNVVDGEKRVEKEKNIIAYTGIPNPCNANLTIPFTVSETGKVSLKIYNILGHTKETIEYNVSSLGYHVINLDISQFSNGLYFYCLKYFEQSITKKFVILK
jgi:hypothetical protein